jgi:predicted porin
LVGAAGGGGLNTGGGLVYQANLGLGYQLNKNLEVMGTIGQMKAAKGDFQANVYGVSLAYKFNALTFRK